MNISSKTVSIVLDVDTDVTDLLREIENIAYANYDGLSKDFVKKYPKIKEIHHMLIDHHYNEDC